MHSMKKLTVLLAVSALSAIGAANASAASFTTSVVGTDLERVSNQPQVFKFGNLEITCTTVAVTGKTTAFTATQQHATVHYSGCTAFGIPVHVSFATYEFIAGDTPAGVENLHIRATITFTVTAPPLIGGTCTVKVAPQKVGTVDYATNGSHILLAPNVTGIDHVGSGGLCPSGNNGEYEGNTTVKAKSGTLAYHH